jgi:heptosyltransferase-2
MDLFQLTDAIDSVIPFDTSGGFRELVRKRKEIRKNKYDIIIDLHNNQRSIFLRSFQKARKFIFNKNTIKKFLLVKFKLNFLKAAEPVQKRYLLTIKTLLKDRTFEYDHSPCLVVRKDVLESIKSKYDFLNSTKDKFIGFCASARHFTKVLPVEKVIDIANSLSENIDVRILLFGDKNDFERNESIRMALGEKCFNMAGKLSLLETAAIIERSDLIISNDSGLMHIADLLGKNLIAIFGSTVREFGFFPQGNDSHVFEVEGLSCRPCSRIGRKRCPKKHFKCMNDIQTDEIIAKANEILSLMGGTKEQLVQ